MTTQAGMPAPLRFHAAGQWASGTVDDAGDLILPADTRRALATIAKPLSLKAKMPVFRQGEPADPVYLIRSGAVRVSHQLENGRNQVIAFHWPGDLFGLAENDLYLNSADTLTECELVRFSRTEIQTLFQKYPQLQADLLVEAIARLRQSQRHLLLVTHQRVSTRVAGFFIECSGETECYDPETGVLSLLMDRADIAEYLNTTTETVSRAIGTLEDRKLIVRLDTRHVRLDLPGLKAVLES
ncbi:hypothetical protein AOE01nite_07520 [Acetobacter oeni]|uniref:Crp/Fnr family transcriptional regulator n=2 Tax=Acetobacter oeni TaxID=304077 RepID=A0A511XHW0_9PROT|nr:hypothetical protein AOE01nite_07520 [Acetobacter oeni]